MKNETKRWNKQMTAIFDEHRVCNVLNKDGKVNYYGKILSSEEANQYFELLMQNIIWEKDEVIIFGKYIATKEGREKPNNLNYFSGLLDEYVLILLMLTWQLI